MEELDIISNSKPCADPIEVGVEAGLVVVDTWRKSFKLHCEDELRQLREVFQARCGRGLLGHRCPIRKRS